MLLCSSSQIRRHAFPHSIRAKSCLLLLVVISLLEPARAIRAAAALLQSAASQSANEDPADSKELPIRPEGAAQNFLPTLPIVPRLGKKRPSAITTDWDTTDWGSSSRGLLSNPKPPDAARTTSTTPSDGGDATPAEDHAGGATPMASIYGAAGASDVGSRSPNYGGRTTSPSNDELLSADGSLDTESVSERFRYVVRINMFSVGRGSAGTRGVWVSVWSGEGWLGSDVNELGPDVNEFLGGIGGMTTELEEEATL